jgi:hypothetical protein
MAPRCNISPHRNHRPRHRRFRSFCIQRSERQIQHPISFESRNYNPVAGLGRPLRMEPPFLTSEPEDCAFSWLFWGDESMWNNSLSFLVVERG